MCGLAGLIGPGTFTNDLKALKQLIYVTALRGSDGTGICTVKPGKFGEVRISKDSVPAAVALWKDTKLNRPLLGSLLPTLFMAHCRDATVGKINMENTHPFRAGSLVGMHNGTLKDRQYFDKSKTDSEMMFLDMAKRGVQKVLEDLNPMSAFAISVYDKETDKVYFARNGLRPLYFALSTKREVCFYASEKEMLQLVLTRCNIDFKIHEARPGILYSINPNDIEGGDELPFVETPLALKPVETKDLNWGEWGIMGDQAPWTEDINEKFVQSVADDDFKVPKFLQPSKTGMKCSFCPTSLTDKMVHYCEGHPIIHKDGTHEIMYACDECWDLYNGVTTGSHGRSAM